MRVLPPTLTSGMTDRRKAPRQGRGGGWTGDNYNIQSSSQETRRLATYVIPLGFPTADPGEVGPFVGT